MGKYGLQLGGFYLTREVVVLYSDVYSGLYSVQYWVVPQVYRWTKQSLS